MYVIEKDFRPSHVKVQCMQLKKLSYFHRMQLNKHVLHSWKKILQFRKGGIFVAHFDWDLWLHGLMVVCCVDLNYETLVLEKYY